MSSQARESGFNPSSPHSSSAKADSYKHEGTPDTRLTAFSPDENSARSNKLFTSLSLSASDPQPLRFPGKPNNVFRPTTLGLQNADKDPFVASSSNDKPDQRLSPTASDFQPFSLSLAAQGHEENLTRGTINSAGSYSPLVVPGIANGFSNGVGLSRYVVLQSSVQSLTADDANTFFKHLDRHGMSFKGKHWVTPHKDKLYFRFTNILDAWLVYHNAAQGGSAWHADLIRPDLWQLLNPNHVGDLETEGQVILLIIIGSDCTNTTAEVEATVYRMLNQEAEIFAFMKQNSSTDDSIKILIEFCDVDAAAIVISKFHNFATDGINLYLSMNKAGGGHPQGARMPEAMPPHVRRTSGPDLSSLFQDMSLGHPSHQVGSLIAGSGSNAGHPGMALPPVGMYPPMLYHNQLPVQPHYMLDPFQNRGPTPFQFGTNMQPFSSPYALPSPPNPAALVPYQPSYQQDYVPRAMAFRSPPDGRRQNAMRVNRSPFYNVAGHHNHVDINRIRDGVDVRSTIMLRNIPNKVDQRMLKNIIDQSSWGKYDFMYLRIDFANDCNVGYAFINFVDPLDIIDFVRERGNQRWNCFKSDKIAEISYATIQGKDCLVSKFRNSSVMLEPPHYRPKLYYTTNGPHPELAGSEEPFPGPDNQSKMKRSCENAEHVGLFTPNAGAHIRDEQRRRRSQFDRGTRHAALEEYEHYRYYGGQQ